jgi:RNA polymerase sigma factor (TIGR02999 family)
LSPGKAESREKNWQERRKNAGLQLRNVPIIIGIGPAPWQRARVPTRSISGTDVTGLLQAWRAGDEHAFTRLLNLVYQDLRRAAHRYMINERLSHTLQTTALINETYLRLVDLNRINFQDRAHFLALCARLMRRILIDAARDHKAKKRGAGQAHISLESAPELAAAHEPHLLAIDDALHSLAAIDDRKAKVVEMRFYGGLTEEEIAAALNISVETVARDWKFSRAWLRKELGRSNRNGA